MMEEINSKKILVLLEACAADRQAVAAVVADKIRASNEYTLIAQLDKYRFLTAQAMKISAALRDIGNQDLVKLTIPELYELSAGLKSIAKSFHELHEESKRRADSLEDSIEILSKMQHDQILQRTVESISSCLVNNVVFFESQGISLPPVDDLRELSLFHRQLRQAVQSGNTWPYRLENYLFLTDEAKTVASKLKKLLAADVRKETLSEQLKHFQNLWREMRAFQFLLVRSRNNARQGQQPIEIIEVNEFQRAIERVREKIIATLAGMIRRTKLSEIRKLGAPNFADLNKLIGYAGKLQETADRVSDQGSGTGAAVTITNIPDKNILAIFEPEVITSLRDKKPNMSIDFGANEELNISSSLGGQLFCVEREDYKNLHARYQQGRSKKRVIIGIGVMFIVALIIAIAVYMGFKSHQKIVTTMHQIRSDIRNLDWNAAMTSIKGIDGDNRDAVGSNSVCGNFIAASFNIGNCNGMALELTMMKRELHYREALQAYSAGKWNDTIEHFNTMKSIEGSAHREFNQDTYTSYLASYDKKHNIKDITPKRNDCLYYSGLEDIRKRKDYAAARDKFRSLSNDAKYNEGRLLIRNEDVRLNREEFGRPAKYFIPDMSAKIERFGFVNADKNDYQSYNGNPEYQKGRPKYIDTFNNSRAIGCRWEVYYQKGVTKDMSYSVTAVVFGPDGIEIGKEHTSATFTQEANSNAVSWMIMHLTPMFRAKTSGTYNVILYINNVKAAQGSFVLNL